jgi:hypothetical protein
VYSPEVETLDQLLGGDLSLTIIRRLYPDDPSFLRGVHALLQCGDANLLATDQTPIPKWRWRQLFVEGKALEESNQLTLSLTDHGCQRIS